MFDATFWVAISFLLFIGLLVYKNVHQIILNKIDSKILELKNKIDEAENLKSNSEKLLSNAQTKLKGYNKLNAETLKKAQKISDNEIASSIEKMKKFLENKEKAAQSKIEQAKNDAVYQVKIISTKVALETVEDVIKENLDIRTKEAINLSKLKKSIEKLKEIN
tara:strand:- start:7160 stop:7651 length:492 start_codon:yes stop_codon:yes gene_type:complete